MKILTLIGLIIISLNLNAQQFNTQNGGHTYTVDIPDYMVKTYQLNDVASMQYQNTTRFAYLIVIEDEKEKLNAVGMKFVDAKVFLDVFLEDYLKDAENRKVGPITEFVNNNNKHAQTELTWTQEGTDFYMIITAVETKDYFYKILCWTTEKNKSKQKNDFLKISKSLKD